MPIGAKSLWLFIFYKHLYGSFFKRQKKLSSDQLEFLLFSTESKWETGAEFITFPFSLQVYTLFYNTPFVGTVVSSIFVLIK